MAEGLEKVLNGMKKIVAGGIVGSMLLASAPIKSLADEINKILELDAIKVEIIQNKISDRDARKLLSYSKNLLNEKRYRTAKEIFKNIKIYNSNEDILDDVDYYLGRIYYSERDKNKTLRLYKKMCYLYPDSDIITEGKLARTLTKMIKKETEKEGYSFKHKGLGEKQPQPNFATSTFAFQILKHDYPKNHINKLILKQAKTYIDKMLDMDLDGHSGDGRFEDYYNIGGTWSLGKINHKRNKRTYKDLKFRDSMGDIHHIERIYNYGGGVINEFSFPDGEIHFEIHGDGPTLRKIVKDIYTINEQPLDPYSWTKQSLKEEIFE